VYCYHYRAAAKRKSSAVAPTESAQVDSHEDSEDVKNPYSMGSLGAYHRNRYIGFDSAGSLIGGAK
jgi:hypothetical protein